MAELDLRLLGRFQARCSSGRPVELTTRKARALLAYLALHAGQAQSREKLIALLWSDRAEKQGRDSLRQALTALRRGLGAEGVALLTVDGDAIGRGLVLALRHETTIANAVLQRKGLN